VNKLSLLAVSVFMVLGASNASAQECPGAMSIPALEWEVECKAETNSTRCGSGLSRALCTENNNRALNNGLVTQDAYDWLQGNGYCAVNIDGVHMIIAICPVGCFEEDTAILSVDEGGAHKWMSAKDVTMATKLLGLNVNALLSSPSLDAQSIQRMTRGDEESDLFVFTLSNGHVLRVTQNHGMVLGDGRVVEARKVLEGDIFVGLDGSDVYIESITREATSADVYNFFLSVSSPQEHIIAAEGVLVGDLAWQSTLASELDSISLRR